MEEEEFAKTIFLAQLLIRSFKSADQQIQNYFFDAFTFFFEKLED